MMRVNHNKLTILFLLLGIFSAIFSYPSNVSATSIADQLSDSVSDKIDDIQNEIDEQDKEEEGGEEEQQQQEEEQNEEEQEESEEEELPEGQECGPGEVKDDESDGCIPENQDDTEGPGVGCADGETRNEAGVCVPTNENENPEEECEDGKYWDGTQCQIPDHCLDNETWNEETHQCEETDHKDCDDGYYWNGNDCVEQPHCDPPHKWNEDKQKCLLEYETDYDYDYNYDYNYDRDYNTNTYNNLDSCPKSFIVMVETIRLPGCLINSANGIGTINFLERNFNNIIVGNNELPNVLLTFTPAELRTTSSGQSIINQLALTAGVDQIQFAFNINWKPEPNTSSNMFTYCTGDDCQTERYSTTF